MRLIGYLALIGGLMAFIYWEDFGDWIKGSVAQVDETAQSTKALRHYANEMIDSAREKAAEALRPEHKGDER
jgi:hypothetical protein